MDEVNTEERIGKRAPKRGNDRITDTKTMSYITNSTPVIREKLTAIVESVVTGYSHRIDAAKNHYDDDEIKLISFSLRDKMEYHRAKGEKLVLNEEYLNKNLGPIIDRMYFKFITNNSRAFFNSVKIEDISLINRTHTDILFYEEYVDFLEIKLNSKSH